MSSKISTDKYITNGCIAYQESSTGNIKEKNLKKLVSWLRKKNTKITYMRFFFFILTRTVAECKLLRRRITWSSLLYMVYSSYKVQDTSKESDFIWITFIMELQTRTKLTKNL